jgi:hypothetical protein
MAIRVEDVDLHQVVRVLRRNQRREDRTQDDQHEDRQAGDRNPALEEFRDEPRERGFRRPGLGCGLRVGRMVRLRRHDLTSPSRTRGSSTE